MSFYKNYPHVFSPGKIGNLTLPNRIIMAPMGTCHTGPDLRFSEELIQFYEERAKGGVGMIISECNFVAPELDPFPMVTGTPRLDKPDKVTKLGEYVERVGAYGTMGGVMLSLGVGRQADAPHLATPISSSECPSQSDPNIMCRALAVDEIHQLVGYAARAAGLAMAAGAKYIELHGHSGYLMDQFLSSDINKRTDEYGGSAENRFRIVKETVQAIKAVVGDAIPVSLRISVDHKCEGYRTLDEGLEYCRMAEEAGFDALHIDAGRYEVMPWIFPPAYLGPCCLADLAAEVKKVVNIPVIAVGNFGTPEEAEEAIASGKCDFVAMARQMLADPAWANKAKKGQAEDIRPCLRCNEMCVGRAMFGLGLSCAVNPECGRETYNKLGKAEEAKKVTVIGGGPGGMVAALACEKRGHAVTLIEKSGELGGLINLAEQENFKFGMQRYNAYLKNQIEKSKVSVLLNTEATLDKVAATKPDAVIVATGSDLFIPGLPGFVAGDKIGTVRDFKKANTKPSDKIVIAGGGIIASETALGLAREGYTDITIVEKQGQIGGDLMMINFFAILGELMGRGVKILTNTSVEGAENDTLICTDAEGKKVELPYDYLLVAMGTKSENSLNEVMDDNFPEVYTIGDCVKTGRIHHAIHQAYDVAKRI